ncbi:MAG: indolepyruvate oxidoreductase subunit beta [Bacteroidota bacterium]|nr:indolepyruvate oxidoreductase subunit beta [Bacteroidota bacterium]
MKTDIILAGVGGQGILSIAAVIGQAALLNNLYIKQSEVHGMSQRGGEVMSHLRISSNPVASDLIPFGAADLIIAVEPMESLRYLNYLSPEGWLVTNTKPFENISNYPDFDKIIDAIKELPRRVFIDADETAHEIGSVRASNMVMLGASVPFLKLSSESVEEGIRLIFGSKGEQVVDQNLQAVKAGMEAAKAVL